ncbi:MAG: hypothetical protein PUE39_03445 [bacterium]|nr:hypothetical protein [bacterium]
MAQSKEDMLTKVEQANHEAERAYWWMKGVDRETAERLDVLGQVSEVLKLLQKVDNITMDITIKIKQK